MATSKYEAPKAQPSPSAPDKGTHGARTAAEQEALRQKTLDDQEALRLKNETNVQEPKVGWPSGPTSGYSDVLSGPRKGSLNDRTRAIELALEAHRGKGLTADEIIKEAAIFEKFLIDGTGGKDKAEPVPAAVDAGMPKAT